MELLYQLSYNGMVWNISKINILRNITHKKEEVIIHHLHKFKLLKFSGLAYHSSDRLASGKIDDDIVVQTGNRYAPAARKALQSWTDFRSYPSSAV